MKTAISLPEPTLEPTSASPVNTHSVSRSELYSQAIKEYLKRHESTGITERINALSDAIDTSPNEFLAHLGARVIN